MRRWMVLLGALLLFFLLPSQRMELGELRPAAVLYVNMEGKVIRAETDTGDAGRGETLDAALADLRLGAPGHVFLDTAEELLLSRSAAYLLPQLSQILRPGVRVCLLDGNTDEKPDLSAASEYLRTHIPQHILAETTENTALQRLQYEGERFSLEDK